MSERTYRIEAIFFKRQRWKLFSKVKAIFFKRQRWKLFSKVKGIEKARRQLVLLLDTIYPIRGRIRVCSFPFKRELVMQFDDHRFYNVEPAEADEFVTTGRCRRTGA